MCILYILYINYVIQFTNWLFDYKYALTKSPHYMVTMVIINIINSVNNIQHTNCYIYPVLSLTIVGSLTLAACLDVSAALFSSVCCKSPTSCNIMQ